MSRPTARTQGHPGHRVLPAPGACTRLGPWIDLWGTLVAMPVLAAGATFVLRHVDPFSAGNLLPRCPLHLLTGLYCPGCGSTRCLFALAHLDIPLALAMNPLLVVSLPVLALMALNAAGVHMPAVGPLIRVLGSARLWLATLVAYGIARNLPWAPFAWLAPG